MKLSTKGSNEDLGGCGGKKECDQHILLDIFLN